MLYEVITGFNLESTYLQIRISKSKTAIGGLVYLYALNKSWQKEIRAENLVLRATLVITSYSIHYTKLYDWQGGIRKRVSVLCLETCRGCSFKSYADRPSEARYQGDQYSAGDG